MPIHKPSYFRNFHTMDISKASLPKEATGEYLHCTFNFLLEKGWKKIGDFANTIKFKAFTLVGLRQLLLSHSRHHINGVLLNILDQHLQKKTLAPMIISETISSLSYYARHPKGRLYGCPTFLQAWLREHLFILASFPTYVLRDLTPTHIHIRSRPFPNRITNPDYWDMLVTMLPE